MTPGGNAAGGDTQSKRDPPEKGFSAERRHAGSRGRGGQPHCTTSGAITRTGGRGEDRMCKRQQPIRSGRQTPAAAMSAGGKRAERRRWRQARPTAASSVLRVSANRKIGLKKIVLQPEIIVIQIVSHTSDIICVLSLSGSWNTPWTGFV